MMFTCKITLLGFIMAEMARMAWGPKREPERKELAVSKRSTGDDKIQSLGGIHFAHAHEGSGVCRNGGSKGAGGLFHSRHIHTS